MTRKPGAGAVRHASKSRPASSGDSQVASIRGSRGRSKQDRIRTQIGLKAVTAGVQGGEGLARRLGDAVVGVGHGGGAVGDRERLARREPDRVVGRGEHHARHPGPAGGLEDRVGAVDVDVEDRRPRVLGRDAAEVDDRVRARRRRRSSRPCRSPTRSRLPRRARRPGERGDVKQPQYPAWPGQPGAEHGPDLARGPGDENRRHGTRTYARWPGGRRPRSPRRLRRASPLRRIRRGL